MASPTRWTWVWVDSRSWWWTGRPGMLQFMGSQRAGYDWATELNWTELCIKLKAEALEQKTSEVACLNEEGNITLWLRLEVIKPECPSYKASLNLSFPEMIRVYFPHVLFCKQNRCKASRNAWHSVISLEASLFIDNVALSGSSKGVWVPCCSVLK